MPISIQGSWSVQVIRKDAELQQRFIIAGASIGNGVYSGELGVGPIQVVGQNWTINIQANGDAIGVNDWINSELRKTNTQVIGNKYVFEVESEDYIQDYNWTDLVLRFTQSIPPTPPKVTPPSIPNNPTPIPSIPIPPQPTIPTKPEPPINMSAGRVFTLLTDDDKLPKQEIKNTYGIWLDYTGSVTGNLLTFFTCSSDTGSYKKSVYNSQCFTCSSVPHFDITYGHDGGSGSRDLGGYDWLTPSNAVYGQYRSLCLNPGERRFKIGSNEIFHFYAINVHRDRMGDRLDEGNIEINIAQLSGSAFLAGGGSRNTHTGSNVKLAGTGKILRLIDDTKLDLSTLSATAYSTFYRDVSSSMCHLSTSAGKVFYIVSGSLEEGIFSGSASSGNTNQPHVYGLSFPQQGIIILDAELLDSSASFLTTTGSDVAGDNSVKLFTAMSGAALQTDLSGDYLGFQARKLKYEYVEQYFIRIKNQEYNFTNNSTYVTGSEGDIIGDFYNNPQVYFSTIGLYNPNHELLAVAKLSTPIFKSYTEESLIEILLKY